MGHVRQSPQQSPCNSEKEFQTQKPNRHRGFRQTTEIKESIYEIHESSRDTSKYSVPLDNDDQLIDMDVEEAGTMISINIQSKDAKCQALSTQHSPFKMST